MVGSRISDLDELFLKHDRIARRRNLVVLLGFLRVTEGGLLDLALNVAGAPALSREAFTGYRQKTIVGVNVEISLPLGDYDSDKRVNFGANRWSIAPEIGVSHRTGQLMSYWILPQSGVVISCTTVQQLTYSEMQTDEWKNRM